MNFADTNWLVAVYSSFQRESQHQIVARYMRLHGGRLLISHPVLLEARNIFSRKTKQASPPEWEELESDFNAKLFVDPMNWHLLRREAESLFAKYAWKEIIGTLDTLIVASAKLAGATRFLSFDPLAAALASAEGMEVFPVLNGDGKRFLKHLTA